MKYVIFRMNETIIPITHEKKVRKEYFVAGREDLMDWSGNIKDALRFGEVSFQLMKAMTKMYGNGYEVVK